MDFYEVVRTRRSIRQYKPDPVPQEILDRIFEAVRLSPSGQNRQPWKFVVVNDQELKIKIKDACGKNQAVPRSFNYLVEAPLIFVACGLKTVGNRGKYMGNLGMLVDVSIACTHLILAARAEGLGTCWVGNFDNSEVKKALALPEEVNVVAITPLGYPKENFREPGERKPLTEIFSLNKF